MNGQRTLRRQIQYLTHMRFTQDFGSPAHFVRGYARGELRIDEQIYRETVIVTASEILTLPDIRSANDWVDFDPSRILAFSPEIVLLGTGERQIFPSATFRAQFLGKGIGLEVMDTGAACRTFNVLVSEQRRVVGLLMV
jgi:uncharacterized protein